MCGNPGENVFYFAPMSQTSTFTMELPYRRSLGPVVGGFLTGLRDQRILASRTAAGRVLCPPLEYDPDTGDELAAELVEVGPAGTVQQWAVIGEPLRHHPRDRPFAWALIRLDGADTDLVHVVDTTELQAGTRVVPRWRDERVGHITDIECFEVSP
jgi:uncharacterized OB-fold protein